MSADRQSGRERRATWRLLEGVGSTLASGSGGLASGTRHARRQRGEPEDRAESAASATVVGSTPMNEQVPAPAPRRSRATPSAPSQAPSLGSNGNQPALRPARARTVATAPAPNATGDGSQPPGSGEPPKKIRATTTAPPTMTGTSAAAPHKAKAGQVPKGSAAAVAPPPSNLTLNPRAEKLFEAVGSCVTVVERKGRKLFF